MDKRDKPKQIIKVAIMPSQPAILGPFLISDNDNLIPLSLHPESSIKDHSEAEDYKEKINKRDYHEE